MEAHGELTRLGFDCVLCKSDKELRAYRGCGVAPDLDAGAGGLPTYDERGRLIPRVISTWDGHAYVDAHYIWQVWQSAACLCGRRASHPRASRSMA